MAHATAPCMWPVAIELHEVLLHSSLPELTSWQSLCGILRGLIPHPALAKAKRNWLVLGNLPHQLSLLVGVRKKKGHVSARAMIHACLRQDPTQATNEAALSSVRSAILACGDATMQASRWHPTGGDQALLLRPGRAAAHAMRIELVEGWSSPAARSARTTVSCRKPASCHAQEARLFRARTERHPTIKTASA